MRTSFLISWLSRCFDIYTWSSIAHNVFQESALSAQEKLMADMKDEIAYLREQEHNISNV